MIEATETLALTEINLIVSLRIMRARSQIIELVLRLLRCNLKLNMSASKQCDRCGACCKTFPVFASRDDAEIEPLISLRGCLIAEWERSDERLYQIHPLPFNRACAFLSEKSLCEIYGTRPGTCRRFEAGSDQCAEARKRMNLAPLS